MFTATWEQAGPVYEHALAQRAKALLRQVDWAGTGRHGNVKGQREEAMKVERGHFREERHPRGGLDPGEVGLLHAASPAPKTCSGGKSSRASLASRELQGLLVSQVEGACCRPHLVSRSGFGHPCSRY